jgi:hypothetical protein
LYTSIKRKGEKLQDAMWEKWVIYIVKSETGVTVLFIAFAIGWSCQPALKYFTAIELFFA